MSELQKILVTSIPIDKLTAKSRQKIMGNLINQNVIILSIEIVGGKLDIAYQIVKPSNCPGQSYLAKDCGGVYFGQKGISAKGGYSFASGNKKTNADGDFSVAMGDGCSTGHGALCSVAMGSNCYTGDSATSSIAMGNSKTGFGAEYSIAMGMMSNTGKGAAHSIAMGMMSNTGKGAVHSVAIGCCTQTFNKGEFACGTHNCSNNDTKGGRGTSIFTVGCGNPRKDSKGNPNPLRRNGFEVSKLYSNAITNFHNHYKGYNDQSVYGIILPTPHTKGRYAPYSRFFYYPGKDGTLIAHKMKGDKG